MVSVSAKTHTRLIFTLPSGLNLILIDPTEEDVVYLQSIETTTDEVARLRSQVDVLTTAIRSAQVAMASAPAWHAMHREAIEQLQQVRKEMEQ